MKKLEAWVDGSCPGNNSLKQTKGGWAVGIRYSELDPDGLIETSVIAEQFTSGQQLDTTNNRMELQAVIEALKLLKYPIEITIHTDSQYVYEGVQRMIHWSETGWRKTDGKPVKNQDLWQQLIDLTKQNNPYLVKYILTKGHADDTMNNRVDKIAVEAARS